MNSKERMYNILYGKECERIPVGPHSWGLYKFQTAGLANSYEDEEKCWNISPEEFARVEGIYYERFKPDWFQLGCNYHKPRTPDREKMVLEMRRELRKLESRDSIDEYLETAYYSEDELRKSGAYDHVPIVLEKYADSVFVAMNEGNPVCEILDPHGDMGFEEGLVAIVEKPDMMEYLLFRAYEKMLIRIKILSSFGCHGYIGSETYCTPDLISPSIYRSVIFPAQKHFYKKVAEMGMIPIVYFLGDIIPLIPDINKLGVNGLMVEESKKTFNLDVIEIRKLLSEDITLFGNLDSVYTLLEGTVEDVVAVTLRQLEAAKYGRFIMANGCPLAFGTPEENILAMLDTARNYNI